MLVAILVTAGTGCATAPSPSPRPTSAGATSTANATAPPASTSGTAAFAPFGTVTLEPGFDVEGRGENVDSIAFWEAPDPADSLMFVTAKGNQLVEVWQQPFVGAEQAPLRHPTFAAGSQVNGIVVDQATDRLYVAVGRPRSTVAVFALPGLTHVDDFLEGSVDLGPEPNLALLADADGTRLYVSDERRIHVLDAASGEPGPGFEPVAGLETMAGDSDAQVLYVPDENGRTGVHAYTADGAPSTRDGRSVFGETVFEADAEGIVLFRCAADGTADDGRGLIVVSDQKTTGTDFEVFDRRTWRHLGVVRLAGVTNTDGIGSTQQALPGLPLGLFAAIDDDTAVAGIGWDRILEATGLGCGT